ncbi:MAG: NSS family neurotransmitter:Na+ symporter [Chlamydiales bacterium]|jgi:NSS family neurotransmitter:Na+ symporter
MKNREHWSSSLGFILAAAGSAVGLGSLWRFPYYTGENGGGLFVLCYLFFTFFVGLPVFMAELVIGRRAQKSPVGALSELSNHSDNWKMLGWFCVFSNFIILSFYSVVAGWGVNYALMSMCHFTENRSPEEIRSVFDVIYRSGDINMFWHSIFMMITVGIVFGGVRKGIEFWSKILMPALLIILFGLFIYSTTLSGFQEAVHFVLYPDPSKFGPHSILKALGMSFFTLSLGLGIVLTYGSYMRPDDDIPKTALIISCINVFVSIIASLMIFPIIFTFGFQPEEGPGLVFKTMPVLFEKLQGGTFLATTFFMVLVFTAITSSISLLEVLVANFIELLDWSRKRAAVAVGIGAFIFGIPSALAGSGTLFSTWEEIYGKDFFNTLSDAPDMLLSLGGLGIAIFVGWYLDKDLVKDEFCKGTAYPWVFTPWRFLVRWIAPTAILAIILHQGNHGVMESLLQFLWK